MKKIIALMKQKNNTIIFYFDKSEFCKAVLDFPILQVMDGLCEYYHTDLKKASDYIREKFDYQQKVPIYLGDSIYFPTQGKKDPQAWINYKYVSKAKKINEYQTNVYFKPFMLIQPNIEYKIMFACNVRVIKKQMKRCKNIYETNSCMNGFKK